LFPNDESRAVMSSLIVFFFDGIDKISSFLFRGDSLDMTNEF